MWSGWIDPRISILFRLPVHRVGWAGAKSFKAASDGKVCTTDRQSESQEEN